MIHHITHHRRRNWIHVNDHQTLSLSDTRQSISSIKWANSNLLKGQSLTSENVVRTDLHQQHEVAKMMREKTIARTLQTIKVTSMEFKERVKNWNNNNKVNYFHISLRWKLTWTWIHRNTHLPHGWWVWYRRARETPEEPPQCWRCWSGLELVRWPPKYTKHIKINTTINT